MYPDGWDVGWHPDAYTPTDSAPDTIDGTQCRDRGRGFYAGTLPLDRL
jgi:hypothetical protein